MISGESSGQQTPSPLEGSETEPVGVRGGGVFTRDPWASGPNGSTAIIRGTP